MFMVRKHYSRKLHEIKDLKSLLHSVTALTIDILASYRSFKVRLLKRDY